MRRSARRLTLMASTGAVALGLGAVAAGAAREAQGAATHADLVALFTEWRAFESPERLDGAPDYTAAAMARKREGLVGFTARLAAIDPGAWPIEQQVDYHLVRAELNGLDFNLRVLQPWARDPAFYASVRTAQSDTPAEEGPTIHGAVRLWRYSVWPRTSLSVASALTPDAEKQLSAELRTIPPLLAQARGNLVGNTRDLWVSGVKTHRNQSATLAELANRTANAGRELQEAIRAARDATDAFADWLERESASKTGPSGIGKDHYTWYLRHVLLLPLTWEDEVAIMQRELARAHASLRLEEHRNRHLPPLDPVTTADEFAALQERSITKYMAFMRDRRILPIEDYLDPALRERVFPFSPEATRNFFGQCTHREPMTLWTHFYHYWDLARMEAEPHPSPIRRGALLYNIWMSRAEGVATGMEEWMMHAGLYDDNPRAREIVWIMLAARAARGLASLHAQANTLDMAGASDMHVEWTPRGWMRRDLDLLGFEQQLYLRQPGYGTSYVTGARLVEDIMAERARQLGDGFTMEGFFAEMNQAGLIPVSLLHWQLTGRDDQVKALAQARMP